MSTVLGESVPGILSALTQTTRPAKDRRTCVITPKHQIRVLRMDFVYLMDQVSHNVYVLMASTDTSVCARASSRCLCSSGSWDPPPWPSLFCFGGPSAEKPRFPDAQRSSLLTLAQASMASVCSWRLKPLLEGRWGECTCGRSWSRRDQYPLPMWAANCSNNNKHSVSLFRERRPTFVLLLAGGGRLPSRGRPLGRPPGRADPAGPAPYVPARPSRRRLPAPPQLPRRRRARPGSCACGARLLPPPPGAASHVDRLGRAASRGFRGARRASRVSVLAATL